MYYQRHLQTVLTKLLNQFPTVLITGARQVGISTLIQKTVNIYNMNTLLLMTHYK